MRSTMFSGDKEINPSNIFDLHIKNLEILIKGLSNKSLTSDMTNPGLQEYIPTTMSHDVFKYSDNDISFLIATFEYAIAGLKRMRDVANEFTPPLTDDQINELVSIPAITKTWDMMMQYKPLQFMNPNLERLTISALDNSSKARIDKIKQLQSEIDRLIQETQLISDLHTATIKRQLPVEELNEIRFCIKKITSSKYPSRWNDEDFESICKLIAASKDPHLTLDQAIKCGEEQGLSWFYINRLKGCKNNKYAFDSWFSNYGYKPEREPRFNR